MLLQVGTVCAQTPPHLSKRQRERNKLLIEGKEKLLLAGAVEGIGQVSELGLLLNGHLLLLQPHHVALEHHKIILAQLVAPDVLSLSLDDVPEGLLLEAIPRGLV